MHYSGRLSWLMTFITTQQLSDLTVYYTVCEAIMLIKLLRNQNLQKWPTVTK